MTEFAHLEGGTHSDDVTFACVDRGYAVAGGPIPKTPQKPAAKFQHFGAFREAVEDIPEIFDLSMAGEYVVRAVCGRH
jgi:hypothetical protein